MKRLFTLIALIVISLQVGAHAQFGGRPGDVVVFILAPQSPVDFLAVPLTTGNDPAVFAGFEIIDPDDVPPLHMGPGYPESVTRRVLHEEPGDVMQLITQPEGVAGPHRVYLFTHKGFVFKGGAREVEFNADVTAPFYVRFVQGLSLGPDLTFEDSESLLWKATTEFPSFVELPLGERGPAVPPDVPYIDFVRSLGTIPVFTPWDNLRDLYPNQGWPHGIQLKLLDDDPVVGNAAWLLRLRPGRQSPLFQITGKLHLFVLQGTLHLTPAGSSAVAIETHQYAFIPGGFTMRLANPKRYTGPGAQ